MTSAADLLNLQDIDLRHDARRALIADIDARLGETEDVIAARELLVTTESEVERLRREQRDLEAKLEDLDAKERPLETRLYDGSVRNPKELTDLQKEVEILKGHRRVLDDAGLALIESLEAATTALEDARSRLKDAEETWRADQADMQVDRERAERESAALGEERARWATGMDAGVLRLYEGLRISRQGRAVARVERSTCGGCRLTIPTQLAQKVRAGTTLVQCPSCERILTSA